MIWFVVLKDNIQSEIRGFVGVEENADVGMEHVKMFTKLSAIKKLVSQSKDSWPFSPKACHQLNLPSIVGWLFNFVSLLLNEKEREKIIVHKSGDLTKLHEAVGRDNLPLEYGGTNGTVEDLIAYWKHEVEQHKDWLIEQTKYKSDEAKRSKK